MSNGGEGEYGLNCRQTIYAVLMETSECGWRRRFASVVDGRTRAEHNVGVLRIMWRVGLLSHVECGSKERKVSGVEACVV